MAGHTFTAFRSNKGFPVLYETGSENQKLSSVRLIATNNFFKKKPIFINRDDNQTLKKYNHALFVIKQGDKIVTATKAGNNKIFELHTVLEIKEEPKSFTLICGTPLVIEDFSNMPFEEFLAAADEKLKNPSVIKSFYALEEDESK